MELLRLAVAARRVGVHPGTLRLWANEGRVPVVWVGRERRFSIEALDALMGSAASAVRREALYVRVSGTSGQESSLAAQEAELRASASGVVVAVFRDRASGLRESRPGLDRLLKRAAAGEFTHVRVTHRDRLARFGASWLIEVLAHRRVAVEVLHAKGTAGGMEELLDDFMSLVATFAGRMYGLRSREARRRLLAEAGERIGAAAAGTGSGGPGRFPAAEAEAEAVRVGDGGG
ncbi:IS607 family transposase [Streptomyces yaanensis]|uniref:IS607 family transposase n=1 Tax=Streptomyces yaanensis TaxID=1142239 RepID=A0ABV7SKN1_9ACTN|nr:IS607 family transposase [Streptomyces sp. CGMCC 4.7035]WNC01452.1 IS607 family transposase [Streptomyces sp. CGMCC 4.7035]